jgi:nucleotide-binding universal stress UspA family protein
MSTIQTNYKINTRIALHNVLITTDFSEASKASLPYAAALAEQFGAKVSMVHVLEPEPLLSVPLDPMPIEDDRAWQDAEWGLVKFARSGELGNKPCKTVLARGDFWTVIAGVISRHKIDLVVTGSRGRKGLSRLALGSSAEKIYRRASCPVLTIGPSVRPPKNGEWKPKQVLFPTDGSETSLKALPYALSLAEENEATLIILQLAPLVFPELRDSEETRTREALRPLVPPDAEVWCKPEFVVRFQFPAEGILELAKEREVDLIVMGVRKSSDTGMPDHLPWPVASRVVAEAPCPVLTVRG